MNSRRDTPLCTAKVKSGEVTLLEPVYDEILAQLKVRNIDVLIVDPFVSSHAVTENDNMAIDAVVKAWARVADAANCAILLVHHTRKENGAKITADSARGAGEKAYLRAFTTNGLKTSWRLARNASQATSSAKPTRLKSKDCALRRVNSKNALLIEP